MIKSLTPFLNRDILAQALTRIGCEYTIQGDEIITGRKDWHGNQTFIFRDGKYLFQHDETQLNLSNYGSEAYKPLRNFLEAVEKEYNAVCREITEAEEQARLERERKEYVEKQKEAIIAKAKAQGYSVREEKAGDKVKLVLRRVTY
jgi:hypothetical protein